MINEGQCIFEFKCASLRNHDVIGMYLELKNEYWVWLWRNSEMNFCKNIFSSTEEVFGYFEDGLQWSRFIENGHWRSPIEEINRYLSPEEELEFEKVNSKWRNSDLNAGCDWSYFEIVHRLKIWMSPNHKKLEKQKFQRQKCHFFGLMDSPWSCASQNSLYAFGSLKPWTLKISL